MRCARPRITSATCPTSIICAGYAHAGRHISNSKASEFDPRLPDRYEEHCCASEGQAGPAPFQSAGRPLRRRPGGQSHGALRRKPSRGHQRRRSAQGASGNPGSQTGVSAIATPPKCAACRQPGRPRVSGADPLPRGGLQHRPTGWMRDVTADIATRAAIRGAGGRVKSSPEPTPMATLSYGGVSRQLRRRDASKAPPVHTPVPAMSRPRASWDGRSHERTHQQARALRHLYAQIDEYNLELAFNSLAPNARPARHI